MEEEPEEEPEETTEDTTEDTEQDEEDEMDAGTDEEEQETVKVSQVENRACILILGKLGKLLFLVLAFVDCIASRSQTSGNPPKK